MSLPYPIRYLLAYDSSLASDVLAAFLDSVFQFLRWKAKHFFDLDSVTQAHPGAVTAIQRSSSNLQLEPCTFTASSLMRPMFLLADAGLEASRPVVRSLLVALGVLRWSCRRANSSSEESPSSALAHKRGRAVRPGVGLSGIIDENVRVRRPTEAPFERAPFLHSRVPLPEPRQRICRARFHITEAGEDSNREPSITRGC